MEHKIEKYARCLLGREVNNAIDEMKIRAAIEKLKQQAANRKAWPHEPRQLKARDKYS